MKPLFSKSSIVLGLALAVPLGFAAPAIQGQAPAGESGETFGTPGEPVSAAIVVRNRAGALLDAQQRTLEDLVAGEITRLGIRVISREDVLENVGTYERGRSATAAGADQLFMDNTSALRLTQNLGADFLLTATILSSDSEDRSFTGYGIDTGTVETSLRIHYRIVGRGDGGSVVSDNIRVSQRERRGNHRGLQNPGLVTSLLHEAAETMAGSLQQQLTGTGIPGAAALPGPVSVYIHATMQDFSIPDVVRREDGQYFVTASRYQLAVFGANVEVNGLTVGSTSAQDPLQVPAGINRLRISRPGYEEIIRTVNFFDGQYLEFPMRMSEDGMARLREMTEFLQNLQADVKLTDAEVRMIEGYAQYLRQSGIRIDYRTDTTEPIRIHQNIQSLFSPQPAPSP